ncbi:hypothetical protein C9I57_26340 [Trinickia symbiotica]|uniref:DUF2493 domain-containing protein n=2 Tax=Trinickia symbiotica TaxID=863227 RepID=A0A2T3XMJ5_9BURK|nr:hypothetical protein C9I57_26340 [Trinickia symbiotica]
MVEDDLRSSIGSKHPLVVAGFSGLGYADPAHLDRQFREILNQKIKKHGRHNLIVVAGATDEGIGRVYDLAREEGIATRGIVSSEAQRWGTKISPSCQHVIYVKRPEDDWNVTSPEGDSYMVRAALGGSFLAFGGGEVAVTEATEALNKGIRTELFPEFEPDPKKVEARRAKEKAKALEKGTDYKDFNATPLRDFVQQRSRGRLKSTPAVDWLTGC